MAIEDDMKDVLERWRERSINVRSHKRRPILGYSVAWWFDLGNASTQAFMAALASESRWVVPGNTEESKLVTNYLTDSDMGDTLGEGDSQVIIDWIAANCPLLREEE